MNDAELNKELQTYYKQVRRLLVGSRKQRDKMMQALTGDVEAFLESKPTADMEAVQNHFGTPQKLGDEMVAAMDPSQLRRYIKRINAWNCFVIIFMVVTVLVVLSVQIQKIAYAMVDRKNVTIGPPVSVSLKDLPERNNKTL